VIRLPGRQVEFTDRRDYMEILKDVCAEVLCTADVCVVWNNLDFRLLLQCM
jgi:hypothetical protein